MPADPIPPMENLLLAALDPKARNFIASRLLTKPMSTGEVIQEAGSPLIHLIFPHGGIVSLQAELQDGRPVERIAIGRDGFLGVEYLLGEQRFHSRAIVSVAGHASWLSIHDFETALARYDCVRSVMLGFTMNLIRQLMSSVVCASIHSASQRVAAWLLNAQDRAGCHVFELTQRALANTLGLRLATVSDACSRLQSAGAIEYSRGLLSIMNQDRLLSQACECYETTRSTGAGTIADRD